MYANGEGVDQDFATAEKGYRRAAAQGYAKAEFNLGLMYELGAGPKKNSAEATKWYRRAAEKGVALAQLHLENLHVLGKGVTQDYATAHMMFNLAGSKGVVDGLKNRDTLAKAMSDDQIGKAQSIARQWKPKPITRTAAQRETAKDPARVA